MIRKNFVIVSAGILAFVLGCGKTASTSSQAQQVSSETNTENSSAGQLILDQFLSPCDLNKWDKDSTTPIIEDYLSKRNKRLVSVTPVVSGTSVAPGSCYWTFLRDDRTLAVLLNRSSRNAQSDDLSSYLRQFMAPCEIREELKGAPKEETDMYFSQGFSLVSLVPLIDNKDVSPNSCLFTFTKSR